MTEQGYDPSIVPWIIGGVVFLIMLFIWQLLKSEKPEVTADAQSDEQKQVAAEEPSEPAAAPVESVEAKAEPETVSAKEADTAPAEVPAEPVAEFEAEVAPVKEEPSVSASDNDASEQEGESVAQTQPESETVSEPEPQKSFFDRVRSGLTRTKQGLTQQINSLFAGSPEIDEDLIEEIETLLLMADVGVEATTSIISQLEDRINEEKLDSGEAVQAALREILADLLVGVEQPLELQSDKKPTVILMVGVNGVGKTTTIGKLAKRYQSEGKKVMLAAGDTFRAAAVEQLQVWGERNKVPVVAQHTGADSASVLFDALQSAQAKGVDVLIADTAGRLQNKDNLMQELQKVVRVMQKIDPSAPHEVMLVLDAGTGQNAVSQARLFGEAVGVTGISLTKLDGTAKGGIIFAIAKQFGLPIRFIGVGEQIDDLRPFEAKAFVDALFD
ncbi:MAG: signal recognition particle-docking protein FtsY [Oceanospirillaceae bacterium]|nr:signal recognition particle-docking protein FtsY [Oceanospirillaceae bacterium]